MANIIQRNTDILRAELIRARDLSVTSGHDDGRIDLVLSYLASDFSVSAWPRPMRDCMVEASTDADWLAYYAGPLSLALLHLATGQKVGRDLLASLRNRLARRAPMARCR
jgi:hypothetical protein